MRTLVLLFVAVLFLLCGQLQSQAMTVLSGAAEPQKKDKGSDQPTGLFGGIRPDGTFVFLFSEDKGTRFYRVKSGVTVKYNGSPQSLDKLPMSTPIRIYTENGRISAVEILEAQP